MESPIYSVKQLSKILGISARAVNKRASKEGWRCIEEENSSGGGVVKMYRVTDLPEAIKRKVLEHISNERLTQGEVFEVASEGAKVWQQLPDREKEIALARLEVLRVVDKQLDRLRSRAKVTRRKQFYRRLKDALLARDDEVMVELGFAREQLPNIYNHIKTVSHQTEYRWRKDYEKSRDELGVGLLGLVRTQRAKLGYGARSLAPEAVAYVRELILNGAVKLMPIRKAKDARLVEINRRLMMHRLENKFGANGLPSYSHFTRWLNGYLAREQEPLTAIVLPSFWRSNFSCKAGCSSTNAVYAGQLWEWDGTPADVMLKDGRHEIIAAMDVFSRDVVCEIERHASAITTAKLMMNGMLRWGKPAEIRSDRGLTFIANHIRSACELLDIDLNILPAYAPDQKPHIESFFGSMGKMLFEAMTWYVGHDPKQRRRIEEYSKFNQVFYHRKGEKISCDATSDDLRQVVGNWLEKIYRVEDHRFADAHLGRSGNILERLSGSPRRAPRISDPDALEVLLSPTIDRVWSSGVEWNGKYMPKEVAAWERMQSYQRQKVRFKPLLSDIGQGTVWEILPDGRTGRLLCSVYNADHGGLSIEEYNHAKRRIEKTHRERRKAVDLLAPPKSYEQELEDMPMPKVAVGNFGASEFKGRHYQDIINFQTNRMPEKPDGGWVSAEEMEQLRAELVEKEQRLEKGGERQGVEGKDMGGTGMEMVAVDWEQVRSLGEAERYEEIMRAEVMGILVPKELKRDARYFEATSLYARMKGYFEEKRAYFAMTYGGN